MRKFSGEIIKSYYEQKHSDSGWANLVDFGNVDITMLYILITVQRDAKQSSLFIILQVHSTCFGVSTTPIIRSTQNCNYSLQYSAATYPPTWPSLATLEGQKNITSTGGCSYSFVYSWWWCGWHPKHVEWTGRIINRLLCVASRWTVINIDQRCTEP